MKQPRLDFDREPDASVSNLENDHNRFHSKKQPLLIGFPIHSPLCGLSAFAP